MAMGTTVSKFWGKRIVELSYAQLEVILVAHFGIHPDRVSTFRSRIKQLQRLQFPSGVNIGRGVRMSYSATHLFQLVSAFELIGLGLPAAQATKAVEDRWTEFAAGYGLADQFWKASNFREHVFIRVMNRTLYDIQNDNGDKVYSRVFVEDLESLTNVLSRNSNRASHSYVVMCATDIYAKVMNAAKTVGGVRNPNYDVEMTTWVAVNSKENWWVMAQGGWSYPWLDAEVEVEEDGNP
jgi:hypothetical protein